MSRKPDWTLRPLVSPAGIPVGGTASQFQAPWTNTLDLLARELDYLRAEHVVLELEITEAQLRIDGELRAGATPAGPRARLSFDSRHGPLSYATGQFGTEGVAIGWKHNVRAIALGLEALRRVDRYGISRGGQQYRGWLQLEAGESAATGGLTVEGAAGTVIDLSGLTAGLSRTQVVADVDTYRRAYRSAAARCHPDSGGDVAVWHELQRARSVLDEHHGLAR